MQKHARGIACIGQVVVHVQDPFVRRAASVFCENREDSVKPGLRAIIVALMSGNDCDAFMTQSGYVSCQFSASLSVVDPDRGVRFGRFIDAHIDEGDRIRRQ